MGLIVQKFGGTSVADAEKIHKAARRAVAARQKGNQVVVVVSAMGDTTDDLIAMAKSVCGDCPPPKREMDQLLVTGEQVTIALMAMAMHAQGQQAISFTGGQIGLVTDNSFSKARIQSINKQRLFDQLNQGKIVIVAGFQGVTPDGEVTTLGRGGSNATLVAVGAVLGADVCENYTDVDGIYTADPRIVPNARKIDRISYDEMLELAGLGASVLQTRAVEFAKKYNVPIHVRNSQNDNEGTWIVAETPNMEHIVVSGAALKKDLTRITLKHVPDQPGVAARIFGQIAAANIVVDDIIQNVMDDQTANVSFTVEHGDLEDIRQVVKGIIHDLPPTEATYQGNLAKVSVVGVGMRIHTGVAGKMFKALSEAKINIQNITTSEIKISCIIDREQGAKALQVVHEAFDLGTKK
ncbi:MAG: aspartate kinase [Phycisphaerales bacterium]|jgi:aspartate kinase|nr:aspartate kinase [Phycisphaerales bacterium]